ncbi:MAG: VCBS repeat-containing protein [Acidobacteria bacterium]|nr:VCBS repeat-containing protein [Acidobacteriota bacterium]
MARHFFKLLIAIILAISLATFTLAQDFAFGGRGNTNNGFNSSVPLPAQPITSFGVTGSQLINFGAFRIPAYLNTTLNQGRGVQATVNATDPGQRFNALDIGVGDFDADGLNDIVSVADDTGNFTGGTASTGTIVLFKGIGDGTFGLPLSLSTTSPPTSLAVGDINLDGLTDFVVGERTGVEVFRGSAFSLSPNRVFLPSASANPVISVSFGRLNGDSFTDIVAAHRSLNPTTPAEVEIFITNPATSQYLPGSTIINTTGSIGFDFAGLPIPSPRAVSTFVFAGSDADIDIGIATSMGAEIFENMTTNPNTPMFMAQMTRVAGQVPVAFLPGDLNNDKRQDFVVLNYGSGTITSYIGSDFGYFGPITSQTNQNPISGTFLNFDGNALPDLLVANFSTLNVGVPSPGLVSVLVGTGTGAFNPSTVFGRFSNNPMGSGIDAAFNPQSVAVGVFDPMNATSTNQRDDLLVADGFIATGALAGIASPGGVLYLDSNRGYNPYLIKVLTAVSLSADFDGAGGRNDLAVIDQYTGTLFVLMNISTTTAPTVSTIMLRDIFTNRNILPTSATAFTDPQTSLSNIAITDVGTPQNTNGIGQIIVGINNGRGFSNNNRQFRQFVASAGATNIINADFRGTGVASDLVYVDYQNNLVGVALNNGGNAFLSPRLRETGGFVPVSAAVGDVNDDDNMDVMVLNSGIAPNQTLGNQSIVSVLLGQGNGQLVATGSLLNVPNFGLSIVGGLAIQDSTNVPRVVDFNNDGFPDFAVNSTRGGAGILGTINVPTVSLILNRPDTPGQFIVRPPVALFDDTVTTGLGNVGNGAVMALDDAVGGPQFVSGRGATTNILSGIQPGIGVGGANYTLAVSDFNADGATDLVVTGSVRIPTAFGGNILTTNYRSSIFLVGNTTNGSIRVSRPLRVREYTLNTLGTADPFANGGDTFVACAVGNFDLANNNVPDVVHISASGSIYIDANITSVLNHAPIVRINRNDLNAPRGMGRKVIITSGQSATIPVSASDVDIPADKLTFSLSPPPTNEQIPSFISLRDNGDNTAAVLISSADINRGPGDLVVRVGVQASDSTSIGTPGERLSLIGKDFFTLIVRPKSPPTIAPIANVSIESGKSQNINLTVNEPDGGQVAISRKCDKDSYVSITGTTLTISPSDADIGTNICTLTASGPTGLRATTSFVITVRGRNIAPIIREITDQNVRAGGAPINIDILAEGSPGDSLRLTLTTVLGFVTLSDNGNGRGLLRISPSLTDSQGGRVTVTATNSGGLSASTSFNVSVQRSVTIGNAIFDTKGKQLFISGSGFGTSGAKVTVNGQDVSSRISGQSDNSITVKGGKKKLNLKTGPNNVVVTAGGVTSNTFVVNLLQTRDGQLPAPKGDRLEGIKANKPS